MDESQRRVPQGPIPDRQLSGAQPRELDDDDPEVIAGMKRLAQLRELEDDVPEVRP